MRSACLSASRDVRTHAHAHTSNLTGRFARENLKCKTETRADADSAVGCATWDFLRSRRPRALYCRRWYRCGALTLFDFAEAVAIDEKLIGTACKKCPCITLFADKSIVIYKSGVFIRFYNILLTCTDALFIFAHCSLFLSLLDTYKYPKLKLFAF